VGRRIAQLKPNRNDYRIIQSPPKSFGGQNALAIAGSAAQDVVSEKPFGEDAPGGTI